MGLGPTLSTTAAMARASSEWALLLLLPWPLLLLPRLLLDLELEFVAELPAWLGAAT